MYPDHTANDDMYRQEPVAVSRRGPPQFNQSNCGYRCGWGCEPREDNDGDAEQYGSDATPTLIGDDGDEETEETLFRDYVESPPPMGRSASGEHFTETNAGTFVVDDDPERQLPSHHVFAWGNRFPYSPSQRSFDGSVSSLDNEASSGAHSSAGSDVRSVSAVSPSDMVAGVGVWASTTNNNHFPSKNYFSSTPLRLSHQSEHCRGNLMPDLDLLSSFLEEEWRRHE